MASRIFAITFFAIVVLLLYQIGIIFAPFLVPVLWAILLGRFAFPLYQRARLWCGGRPSLAAAVVTVGILIIAVVPLVYFTFLFVQQSMIAYSATLEWIQRGGAKEIPQYLGRIPIGGGLIQEQIDKYLIDGSAIEETLVEGTKTVGTVLLVKLSGVARNAFSVIVDAVVMLFTLFFVLRDGERLYARVYRLLPLPARHKDRFVRKLDGTMMAVMKGVILTAVAQSGLAGAAYLMLDVPFPLVMIALTALCSLLPFGGTALVWGPLAVYLFWAAAPWKAIVLAVWGTVVVVGMVDNVLKPMLIGRGTHLPTLFLFFSILGGLAAYGFIGMFIGPVVLAVLLTALHIYEEDYGTGWEASSKPKAV